MNLIIDSEFQSYIPPLTPAELSALEFSILASGGAHTPIDTWRGVIIDGHNRYEICQRLRLPFQTREHAFPDRDAVKAWMFQHQIARRNLSADQITMLAALRSVETTAGTTSMRRQAQLVATDPARSAKVLAGRISLRTAWNLVAGERGMLPPRAPRGPSVKPAIPEGHELSGVSTLTGPAGELKAEWNKTRIAGADDAPNAPVPEGHHIISTSTMLRGDGTTGIQWITSKADEVAREAAMLNAWARHAAVYAGLADPVTPPEHSDDDLISLYPLGDPHVGMLAWAPESGDNFDLKIATSDLLECVRLMVAGAPRSKRAIITNLGDFLHAQSDEQRTPGHGHKLDVDGRYSKVLDAGHVLLRGIVDAALAKHEHVTIRNLPGNHDPQVAAELAMWLRAVYEREPRVTVAPAFASYQFDRFGCCLFGWAHGDGAKSEALPLLMANTERDQWGATTEHVWHTGHVHHLSRKEYTGCVVETHRTMAGKDFWHASKGYSAKRSLQVISYHREFGEVSRNTVGLERVRAAMKAQ